MTNNLKTSLLVLLILVVLFLCYFLLTKKYIKLFIIVTISFIIWVFISDINHLNIQDKENILKPFYNNEKHELIFKIEWINKISDYQIEYIARLNKVWETKINKTIKSILKVSKSSELNKWNIIKTNSKLYEFKDFDWFSYKNYMLSKNLFFSTNIYSYEIIDNFKINNIELNIIKLRKHFLKSINEIYPKEEAIFLWWILIWARESLPDELKTNFNNSWLTHFIAVSWFNITILIVFVTFLLQYFPIYIRIILISLFVILFTILVWNTAPVIRASIMGLIWYYVLISWRTWNILSIIILTAIIMILFSPLSLNYDISLHLSFLAVLWIIYSQKFFEKIFNFLPNFLEIKTAFTLTISALIFTLPIMIFSFWQVSILAPLANIAVTWTIPFAMLFGFISVIVHTVYPIWWIFIWYITWIFLKWDIIVVHFFWKLEWSLLKIDLWIYKIHLEILYFIILIFIIIWFRKKE